MNWWLREAGVGAEALERFPPWQDAFTGASRIASCRAGWHGTRSVAPGWRRCRPSGSWFWPTASTYRPISPDRRVACPDALPASDVLAGNLARLLDDPAPAKQLRHAAAENVRQRYGMEAFRNRLTGLANIFL